MALGLTAFPLARRLSPEQVNYLMYLLPEELSSQTGRPVAFKEIITACLEESARSRGLSIEEYFEEDPPDATEEEVAVAALCWGEAWLSARPGLEPRPSPILSAYFKPPSAKVKLSLVEPLPREHLEALKELIKRAALRKLKELEELAKAEERKVEP